MSNIEKIRQEIERRIENYWSGGDVDSVVVSGELEELIDFIDSLPDESKVDVTDFCKPIDPSIAQCIADNWWEMLGEEEKHSEDLEEAAKEYATTHLRNNEFPTADSAFIAGAEWQYQKDRYGFSVMKAKNWEEGFNDGRKAEREKMMKGAVEMTVGQLERQWGGNIHFMHGFEVDELDFPFLNSQECGYGDKVKVIVIKEDKED